MPRGQTAGGIALVSLVALVVTAVPVGAQDRSPADKSGAERRTDDRGTKLGVRNVSGTVKSTASDGLVVVGREKNNKEREWAFSVDDKTAVRRAGQAGGQLADLKEGDAVTVSYTERDGKVVAQSVTVTGAPGTSTREPARKVSDPPARKP